MGREGRTDWTLAARAIAGDDAAFGELARVYRPRLEAIGRRWFSDAYLAEELAQETLVLASRAVGSLREPGAFGAWLVAIARNVARQRWRSRDTLDTAGELAIPATAAVPDPSDLSSLRTALQRASQVLPEPQQQVVELCLREGQTVQEASEMLGVRPQTVKGRLQRAREALRKELSEMVQTEAHRPGKTVLIVDDEGHIVRLLEVNLQQAGYETLSAGDGIAALQVLETTTPDLIILDLMMPRMHGWDVLRRVRARPQTLNTPVLILSAVKSTDPRNGICHELADAYMEKPFNPVHLLAWVDRRLDHLAPDDLREMVDWRRLRFSDRLAPQSAAGCLGAGYGGVRMEARRVLQETGEEAVEALGATVRDGPLVAASAAIGLLGELLAGPRPGAVVSSGPFPALAERSAAEAIAAGLSRPERELRWSAYETLAASPGVPSLSALVEQGASVFAEMVASLHGGDESLRRQAAWALGRINTPEAHRALKASYLAALSSQDRATRFEGLAHLGDLGGLERLAETDPRVPDVVGEMVGALESDDATQRRDAVLAMARIRLPRIRQALQHLADTGSGDDAHTAQWALDWQER